MLGADEDSDSALMDSREEYGSSTYPSDHSTKDNVDVDGVSKSMNKF
jgi:hypothetical protein